MARLYRTAHRLRVAAQDEPVRLRGWAAVAATLGLQAIILASQGLDPWAIAGTLATLALPLLGLEAARARVSPVDPSPDQPPPPRPPRGAAGNVRLPRADQRRPGGLDLDERHPPEDRDPARWERLVAAIPWGLERRAAARDHHPSTWGQGTGSAGM